MRKYLVSLLLLMFFWIAIAVRGNGELGGRIVASASNPMEAVPMMEANVAGEGIPALAAMGHGMAGFSGDFQKVVAILAVSMVLALRRRARIIMSGR